MLEDKQTEETSEQDTLYKNLQSDHVGPYTEYRVPQNRQIEYISRRFPKMDKRHSRLKALVRILSNRLSNMRRNLNMNGRISILSLIFSRCLNSYRH